MSDTTRTSDWFVRAVIAAAFSIVGFFGKDLYEDWKHKQAAELARLDSLVELSALLDESKSIFESQNSQAKRLTEMLVARNPGREVLSLAHQMSG